MWLKKTGHSGIFSIERPRNGALCPWPPCREGARTAGLLLRQTPWAGGLRRGWVRGLPEGAARFLAHGKLPGGGEGAGGEVPLAVVWEGLGARNPTQFRDAGFFHELELTMPEPTAGVGVDASALKEKRA